jgi:hypothetical protein
MALAYTAVRSPSFTNRCIIKPPYNYDFTVIAIAMVSHKCIIQPVNGLGDASVESAARMRTMRTSKNNKHQKTKTHNLSPPYL